MGTAPSSIRLIYVETPCNPLLRLADIAAVAGIAPGRGFHLTPAQEPSYRDFAGEGVFRLSVGIEDPADLCRDLEQALSHLP